MPFPPRKCTDSSVSLQSIKPKLGGLAHRVGASPKDEAERTKQRDQSNAWRAWYKTAEWRNLRQAVLIRDKYTCQRTGVLLIGKYPAPDSPVVDHIRPHRGDAALFFDIANLQAVSKAYHDGAKQREEQGEIKGVWY